MRSPWDAFAMALILAGLVVFAGVSHACEVRGPVAGAEGFGRGHALGAPLGGLVAGYVFCMRDAMSQEIAYQAATATKSEANAVTSARRIAASIGPFYGEVASREFLGLLARRCAIVRLYVEASRAGSAAKQGRARAALLNNTRQLADFLSGLNRYLPRERLLNLLEALTDHQIQDIRQLLEGRYEEEGRTWQQLKTDAYAIADALSRALAEQFMTRIGDAGSPNIPADVTLDAKLV